MRSKLEDLGYLQLYGRPSIIVDLYHSQIETKPFLMCDSLLQTNIYVWPKIASI